MLADLNAAFEDGGVEFLEEFDLAESSRVVRVRLVSASFRWLSDSDRKSAVYRVMLAGQVGGMLRNGIELNSAEDSAHYDTRRSSRPNYIRAELDRGSVLEFHIRHGNRHDTLVIETRSKDRAVDHATRQMSAERRNASIRRRSTPQGEAKRLPSGNTGSHVDRAQARPAVPTEALALRHSPLLWGVPVVLLVAALLPWPYAYYVFLRLSICGASAFLAYGHWAQEDAVDKWVLAFVAIAILYNPVVPIYLAREVWIALNVATAAVFVLHFLALRRRV